MSEMREDQYQKGYQRGQNVQEKTPYACFASRTEQAWRHLHVRTDKLKVHIQT